MPVHGVSLDPKTWKLLGVDRCCVEWAFASGVKLESRPPDRLTWGDAAGSIRDKQMIEAGARGLVALPGAAGWLFKLAERFNIPVWRPFGNFGIRACFGDNSAVVTDHAYADQGIFGQAVSHPEQGFMPSTVDSERSSKPIW